jgi:uncharacterized protein HemY
MRTVRYGLAAVAVVASVWFAIGARQVHDLNAATTLLNGQAGKSAGASRHTASLLSSAAFLYPGVDVTLLRARLEMERKDYPQAKALVDRSIASEPNNVSVWLSALDLALVDPREENTHDVLAHLRTEDPFDLRDIGGG